ncbi:MAG: LCP family protein [Eubacterium sp.]
MEKESYSIDDILSEVKKRREENELALKNNNPPNADNQPSAEVEQEEASFVLDEEEPNDTTEDESDETAVFSLETEEKTTEKEEFLDFSESEISQEPQQAEEEPEKEEAVIEETEPEDNAQDIVVDNQSDENGNAAADTAEPETDDGMVDLLSLAAADDFAEKEEMNTEKNKSKKSKKHKATVSVIVILLVLIICAGVFAILYANNLLDKITNNSEEEPYEMVTYYDGMDFLQEDFPTIDELSASELYSYKEYLKQWYQNGDPVSSTHVLNILLIGEDTRDEEISDTSRADSAIIASVNIDTGEIHLTSILRDLYVYYEVDGEGRYGKINESASNGGMKTYINTIERYYKIAINNYAVVNFESFPKIIDALNGVSIKITSAEINEINNHPKRYGGVTITQSFDGTEGTMTLNGKQALAYCRIRKIDSDGARANRQKTVLNALFKKMKSSGTVDIVKTVNDLVGYVYTGYSKKELIEIGNTALKDGWLNYEVKSSNIPSTENCKGGQNFSAAPGNWIWLADIPKDAYELQMRIYGKSNINLNPNRPDYIAMGR